MKYYIERKIFSFLYLFRGLEGGFFRIFNDNIFFDMLFLVVIEELSVLDVGFNWMGFEFFIKV